MLTDPALAELRSLFGARLSLASAALAEYAQSESLVTAGLPDAVVYPGNTNEVASLARWSSHHLVPLIGWGAGTSLDGHALALIGRVVVDFCNTALVLEVRPEDRLVRVQPGITREALNHALRTTGLMFPVDPGPVPALAAWQLCGPRARPPSAMAQCGTM